jgi:hypothetical protein
MDDLQERLRKLNNLRATLNPGILSPNNGYGGNRPPAFRAEPREQTPLPIENLLSHGNLIENNHGAYFHIPTHYEIDYRHGGRTLQDWLGQDMAGAALFVGDERLGRIDPRRCLFLDTETTGLGSAAVAFLVGVGFFTDDGSAFEVAQFFLRNPGEEPAMLHALQNLMQKFDALVTFNGRSFDVPLLESRYTMNRQRLSLAKWANLDLLFPARKLWKRRLESCRLANLEVEVLGVERTDEDVPGMLIPHLYYEYVQSNNAREMQRVIYHNLIDILSMVTLGAQLCETFSKPHGQTLPGEDWLSLARWYDKLGRSTEAHSAYETALRTARLDSETLAVIQDYTAFLKKQDRAAEAVPLWQDWAALQPRSPDPRLELSKFYEWTQKDAAQAIQWAQAALDAVQTWSASAMREAASTEIEHRLDRLRRKNRV